MLWLREAGAGCLGHSAITSTSPVKRPLVPAAFKVARSWREFFQAASPLHYRSALLKYLFPHASLPARQRIHDFKYTYLPRLRHRAQSRIYRYLVARQARKQRRRTEILASLRLNTPRRSRRNQAEDDATSHTRSNMAYSGPGSGLADAAPYAAVSDVRESGSKRKKLAGYLKAANEIRHSYFNNDESREGSDESAHEGLGAFPETAVVRSGNEEMMLFPSYGRNHVKSTVRRHSNVRSETKCGPTDPEPGATHPRHEESRVLVARMGEAPR